LDSKDYGMRNQQLVYCRICGKLDDGTGWFFLWGESDPSLERFNLGCMECFELNQEAIEIAKREEVRQ
jgi:hypothetical protein